jgi:hypothetical protein
LTRKKEPRFYKPPPSRSVDFVDHGRFGINGFHVYKVSAAPTRAAFLRQVERYVIGGTGVTVTAVLWCVPALGPRGVTIEIERIPWPRPTAPPSAEWEATRRKPSTAGRTDSHLPPQFEQLRGLTGLPFLRALSRALLDWHDDVTKEGDCATTEQPEGDAPCPAPVGPASDPTAGEGENDG